MPASPIKGRTAAARMRQDRHTFPVTFNEVSLHMSRTQYVSPGTRALHTFRLSPPSPIKPPNYTMHYIKLSKIRIAIPYKNNDWNVATMYYGTKVARLPSL